MKKIATYLILFVSLYSSDLLGEEKFLFCATSNGLCNRLRSVASCYVNAKFSNRTLLVLWLSPPQYRDIADQVIGHTKWEDLFVYPKLNFTSSLPPNGGFFGGELPDDSGCFSRLDWKYIAADSSKRSILGQAHSTGAEVELDMPDSIKNITIQTFHNTKIRGLSDEEFYRERRNFYSSLVPVPYVSDLVNEILAEFGDNVVGVHFRSTDMLHVFNALQPAYSSYVKFMDDEIARDPNVQFYIATDNSLSLDFFIEKYKDRIIYSKKISYCDSGPFMYWAERHNANAMKNALVDLLLLSKTRKIIGCQCSSFSYEAACMGDIPLIEISHRVEL